jgi:hypothetical protein
MNLQLLLDPKTEAAVLVGIALFGLLLVCDLGGLAVVALGRGVGAVALVRSVRVDREVVLVLDVFDGADRRSSGSCCA